jgi:hypothetical protein
MRQKKYGPYPKCTCDDHHNVNGHRGDGMPVAMWACPQHGNLFEEVPLGISLTHEQNEVLRVLKEENDAGRPADADAVSKILNYSTWRTKRAFAVLQSIGFIEAA